MVYDFMRFKEKPIKFYDTPIFFKSNIFSLLCGSIFIFTLLYSNKFQIKTHQMV